MTPEDALKFLGFLALVEELDEEEEPWYEYYVTREEGYSGGSFRDAEFETYYSQSESDEDQAINQFLEEFGDEQTYIGHDYNREGKSIGGHESEISVDIRQVPKDEVDDSNIL